MIVIIIEMWPGGDQKRAYRLGQAAIANMGGGTREKGNYKAVFGLKKKVDWRVSDVHDFPRLRKNVWFLLKEALRGI